MAELKKIKQVIRELAGRRKNVRLSEIEWVVNSLELIGYAVRTRSNEHQKRFTVQGRAFSICTHHTGNSQVKACYVDEFVDAMIDLELYDED